jgi:hypothetical protein
LRRCWRGVLERQEREHESQKGVHCLSGSLTSRRSTVRTSSF